MGVWFADGGVAHHNDCLEKMIGRQFYPLRIERWIGLAEWDVHIYGDRIVLFVVMACCVSIKSVRG